MPTYLIEEPHTEEECRIASEQWLELAHPRAQELFDATYFGCEAGVHNSWLIAEFDSEDEAWKTVVEVMRPKAKIVQVNAYSFEEMLKAHGG